MSLVMPVSLHCQLAMKAVFLHFLVWKMRVDSHHYLAMMKEGLVIYRPFPRFHKIMS
jgi:hypothetical protein